MYNTAPLYKVGKGFQGFTLCLYGPVALEEKGPPVMIGLLVMVMLKMQ